MLRTVLVALSLVVLTASLSRADESPDHDHPPRILGALFPRIAPSGDTIAYSHQGAIWRVSRSGGVATRLTSGKGFDVEPTWSPEGDVIAFIAGVGSFSGRLTLIHADDGSSIELPREVAVKDRLFFHPDGDRILGRFRQPGGRVAMAWVDLDSGQVGEPLRADVWGERYALSPDGETIAVVTTLDVSGEQGGNNGPQCDLWTMPSEGGELTKVVQFPGRVYEVSWAADGEGLYVVSNVGGVHNDIWQVPLDEPLRGARKLTFGQADEDMPSVSRDGRWLVFTDNRHGPTELVARDQFAKTESVVTAPRFDFGTPTGKWALRIIDAENNKPMTARVTLQHSGGKFHAPAPAIYRILRGDMHFYCEGTTELEVPAGRYVVKVARGPEYPVVRREVDINVGENRQLVVPLKRWTNQRERGWYSGESHIHANYGYGQWYNSPRTMLAQSAGEDLIVSNFMVANSEADGVFDREYFRGEPDPLSTDDNILYWNEEFRSTIWGHLTLLNLKQLVEPIFTGFGRTTHPHDHPTNADIADLTHDQDGHVNYTHPASNVKDPYLSAYSAKALPLDVALGKVDSIDVMGANHVANMAVWYRLLNCGFRVPAAAGTDCFLNRVRSRLPGQVRVYVHVDGDFTYERWIENLQAGKTFVTDGPMLDLSVNEQSIGATIKLDKPQAVRVVGQVRSRCPLDRVEIIVNGEVARAVKLDGQPLAVDVDESIDIAGSGWIALRASGPSHPDQPTGNVFGHTSPVYVDVADRSIDTREDAEYFVKWIDRLRTDIRRRNRIPSRHQVHVESQISAARDVFNRLLGE